MLGTVGHAADAAGLSCLLPGKPFFRGTFGLATTDGLILLRCRPKMRLVADFGFA